MDQQKRARVWGDIWEAYKLVVNPFWLVNPNGREIAIVKKQFGITAPVLTRKKVISRAYHKMLEILAGGEAFGFTPGTPFLLGEGAAGGSAKTETKGESKDVRIELKGARGVTHAERVEPPGRTVAAIAEAPGGFAQAIAEYGKFVPGRDHIYGISIVSEDIKVPKFAENVSQVFTPTFGRGSGDVCRIENIDEYAKNFEGKHAAVLATADGGFEVHNWLEKEAKVAHLAWSELYTATRCLAPGGSFVCKLYSLYTEPTLQILYHASGLFTRLHICKPVTSRITNTEHYFVATGFRGLTSAQAELLAAIKRTLTQGDEHCGASDSSPYVQTFIKTQIPKEFVRALCSYNSKMEALRESVSREGYDLIVKTIHGSREPVSALLKKHAEVSAKWLTDHGIAVDSSGAGAGAGSQAHKSS